MRYSVRARRRLRPSTGAPAPASPQPSAAAHVAVQEITPGTNAFDPAIMSSRTRTEPMPELAKGTQPIPMVRPLMTGRVVERVSPRVRATNSRR